MMNDSVGRRKFIRAFEIVETLRRYCDELKQAKGLSVERQQEIEMLKQEYEVLLGELIHYVVKRRHKRRRQRSESDDVNCDELIKMLNSKEADRAAYTLKSLELERKLKQAKEAYDAKQQVLNKQLAELNDLNERVGLFKKLLVVRGQQRQQQHGGGSENEQRRIDATKDNLDELAKKLSENVAKLRDEQRFEKNRIKALNESFIADDDCKKAAVLKKYENLMRRQLFGDDADFQKQHENDVFFQSCVAYHCQADKSLESLVLIRKEWDSFAEAKYTCVADTVPLEYVYPNERPNEEWAQFLV